MICKKLGIEIRVSQTQDNQEHAGFSEKTNLQQYKINLQKSEAIFNSSIFKPGEHGFCQLFWKTSEVEQIKRNGAHRIADFYQLF